ncbi:MAG: hypothetical protein ACXVHX_02065 [Solirubrobacteraceae bacterium]
MTERLGFKSWAAGALALAAISACEQNGANPSAAPSSPEATSSPTEAASSSASASPTEQAASQARQKLKDYYALLDKLGQDPTSNLKPLKSVAISTELTAEQHFFSLQHAHGERQIGDLKLLAVAVQSVTLDNTDPKHGRVPTVVIDVCHDVSGTDVIDKNGKSVVLPTRPVRGWTRWWVANYQFTKDPAGGWRVASGKDLTRTPCPGS